MALALLSLFSIFNDCLFFTSDFYIKIISVPLIGLLHLLFHIAFLLLFLNINAQYNCFYLHKLGKYKKLRNVYLSSLFHSFV